LRKAYIQKEALAAMQYQMQYRVINGGSRLYINVGVSIVKRGVKLVA